MENSIHEGSSHGFQGFRGDDTNLCCTNEDDNRHDTTLMINDVGDQVGRGEVDHHAFVFPAEANMASGPGAAVASGSSSSILQWPPLQAVNAGNESGFLNQAQFPAIQERFFHPLPPAPLPPSAEPPLEPFYHDLQYARRASASLQFAYDGGGLGSTSSDPLGLAAGIYNMGMQDALLRAAGGSSGGGGGLPSSPLFGGLHAEFAKLTPREIMDAKALAASKSHSEAERRRRERINGHLSRLRSMLPSTTKTDKASLLAEVIHHVKELKRQTTEIAEESPLPTESDELTVDAASDEDGKLLVRASLCCDDRSDLLPDIIKALKVLRLRTLKAEITTLGGRVKNVLLITRDDDGDDNQQAQEQQSVSIASIQDALKAVMEHPSAADEPSTAGGIKRQRTTNLSTILEHRSI